MCVNINRGQIEDCLRYHPAEADLDSLLVTVAQLDIVKALQMAVTYLDNWWFVTHISNLLYHLGILEPQ